MDYQKLVQQIRDYYDFFKKHSFNDSFMKKRTLSTLNKLVIFAGVGAIALFVTLVFILFPGVSDLHAMQKEKASVIEKIYGKAGTSVGLKYVYQQKQKELQEKEDAFTAQQKKTIETYDQALLKNADVYDIAVFFEDYATSFSTQDKPIVFTNISFGKSEAVSVPANSLKQEQKDKKITVPAEYRVLPVNISAEAHRERFEQFLEFMIHSGDVSNYYFKGKPVPMMTIESLNLPLAEPEKPEEMVQTYSLKVNFYMQKEETLQKKTPETKAKKSEVKNEQ